MHYLPIFLRGDGRHALIVGGGSIATRKAHMLVAAGFQVTVVAPQINQALREQEKIHCASRPYQPCDLNQMDLVFVATDNSQLNAEIARTCAERGLLCNAATDSLDADFLLPALIKRDPILIAISTTAASPALARLLKARLEMLIPESYSRLAQLLEQFRHRAKTHFKKISQRRHFWQNVLEGPIADLVHAGRDEEAHAALEAQFTRHATELPEQGEVYIVGAGPGDPDLLTIRALRLIQQADVVVWDRLVSPPIRALIRPAAEQIYAGKRRAEHTIEQGDINQLLVDYARQGKKVCRLKGGDPFIFGRGGEEAQTLAQAGVAFQIVPGITAASGCASYAGIPLTHRDYAQSVRFITGNLKSGTLELDWPSLSQSAQTLVFYMGMVALPIIQSQLLAHGRSPDTPAAMIQQGTTPHQRVVIATLSDLAQTAETAQLEPPSLIVIGEVVSLYHQLKWFRTGADSVSAKTGYFD